MRLEEYLDEELKKCNLAAEAVELLLGCGVRIYTNKTEENHEVYHSLEDGVVIRTQYLVNTSLGKARTYGAVYDSGLAITGFVFVDTEYEVKEEKPRSFFG